MITSAVIALFKLPKKIFDFTLKGVKAIKDTIIYLFVPEEKRKNKKRR